MRAAIPVALELPCCKAADVDVELVQSGVVTIAGELDLELHLIFRDGLAAHRAARADSRPAPMYDRAAGMAASQCGPLHGLLPAG